MRKIREQLTYANVMATIAVFIAIGGTASAAVIITSNSQVAPNTISGHHPPSGAHANVIGGSLNGQDLAPGAVTAGKIANNTIRSPQIINGEVQNADLAPAAEGGHIVARIRSTAPTTTAGTSVTQIPLSGAQWTQLANEVDHFVGVFTYTNPTDCTGAPTAGFSLAVEVNGKSVGGGGSTFAPPESGVTSSGPLNMSPDLFEPGHAVDNQMTVGISDSCVDADQHYTVKSVKIDAIGYR